MSWWNYLDAYISSAVVKMVKPSMWLIQFILSGLSLLPVKNYIIRYPPHADVVHGESFDFIVVGGGTAGCILAARLAEVHESRILLIEAGGDPPIDTVLPSLTPFVANTEHDWNYFTEDDGYSSQAHKTKNIRYTQGKMLGGSSSANYMYYVRGNMMDYERWVDMGGYYSEGWGFDNVTYYFKKSEGNRSPEVLKMSPGLHMNNGPVGVTRIIWDRFTFKYVEVFESVYDFHIDTNRRDQMGYSLPQYTFADKIRQSTANCFLPFANRWKNLYVLKNTLCTKVLFSPNLNATGVEVILPNKKRIRIKAILEVILSAGAIGTPKLLMLSGIGPSDHLTEKGIRVLVDQPHVGQHLQDHPTTVVILTGPKGIESAYHNFKILENMHQFPTPTIMGFQNLDEDEAFPDYQTLVFPFPAASLLPTLICSFIIDLDDQICTTITEIVQLQETLFTLVSLMHPISRGRIELRSKDPAVSPKIFTGYYSNSKDLDLHARSVRDYISIINTKYLLSVNSTVADLKIPQCVDKKFNSHEYWKCHILNTATTVWHPVGTCSMNLVVDGQLRVKRVGRLRIGDASIMPEITSGNTNAPCMMIAEKLADMVKQRWRHCLRPHTATQECIENRLVPIGH